LLAIPGVSTPYSAFWILAHNDGPTFHLLWLFCSNILLCLDCCSGRASVGRSHTHFYAVEHSSRIVLKAYEFQPLTHLPTREIGSLLFVPTWCTLLAERPCLHCHSSNVHFYFYFSFVLACLLIFWYCWQLSFKIRFFMHLSQVHPICVARLR
jgi:hypothetical protein